MLPVLGQRTALGTPESLVTRPNDYLHYTSMPSSATKVLRETRTCILSMLIVYCSVLHNILQSLRPPRTTIKRKHFRTKSPPNRRTNALLFYSK